MDLLFYDRNLSFSYANCLCLMHGLRCLTVAEIAPLDGAEV
jgi:hypothetical protein